MSRIPWHWCLAALSNEAMAVRAVHKHWAPPRALLQRAFDTFVIVLMQDLLAIFVSLMCSRGEGAC